MDDRPLKLLQRTPVDEAHVALLETLATHAMGLGDLQFEFGKTHVGFIIGCNQFLRIHRGGDLAGQIELRLSPEGQAALTDAGVASHEPEGMVFKMFGWTRHAPMEGKPADLQAAVDDAFALAAATQPSSGL